MSISIPQADFTPQLAGYTGQGAFRFWCQKVLPIVYDDSLSYYELLNKVVNYLNNVIADVASVEENIGKLNDSYVDLQNYVNEHMQELVEVVNIFTSFVETYFDNLDVQEEINNKLNHMASDGSLSALIAPIVVSTAPEVITEWLSEHITPTSPPVDNTLSVSGAAADAAVTGNYALTARALKTGNKTLIPANVDFNNYTTPGTYKVPSTQIGETIQNTPSSGRGTLVVETNTSTDTVIQKYIPAPTARFSCYVRNLYNGNWSVWHRILTDGYSSVSMYRGQIDTLEYTQLSQCLDSGWYGCSGTYSNNLTDLPDGFGSVGFTLFNYIGVFAVTEFTYLLQRLVTATGDNYYRVIDTNGVVRRAWVTDGLNDLYFNRPNIWERTPKTKGRGVNAVGSIVSAPDYQLTDNIDVSNISVLYCRSTARYCFYDENDAVVESDLTTNGTPISDGFYAIKVPDSAVRLLVCAKIEYTDCSIYCPSIVEEYLMANGSWAYSKKLGVVGHSGPYGTRLSNRLKAWPYLIKNELRMGSIQNNAIGGSTIAKKEGSYDEIFYSLSDFQSATKDTTKTYLVNDEPTDAHPYMLYHYVGGSWVPMYETHTAEHEARTPVVDIVKTLDLDLECIILGCGANDYHYSWTPLGEFSDRTKYTFYGALHLLLGYISDTYKGIPVFFTDAVIPDTIGDRGTEVNDVGKTYNDYRNAIIEVCNYYRIMWIDMDKNTNIPPADIDPTWYASDLLHMSQKGHDRVGHYIGSIVKNYLI